MLAWNVIEFGENIPPSELRNALVAIKWATDYLLKTVSQSNRIFVQIILGYSQVWGIFSRFFIPLGMAPVVGLVGLGLFQRGFPVINELVVQALRLTSRKATKEVESFANFLSEMQNSLKPWIPRFKALFDESPGPENLVEQSVASEIAHTNAEMNYVESPEQTTMVSLVSPSPLVSWRADGKIERGRQLFLLTPLPRSKELLFECDENSKSMLKNVTSRKSIQPPIIFDAVRQTIDNVLEGISVEPTPCKTSDYNMEANRVFTERTSPVSPLAKVISN